MSRPTWWDELAAEAAAAGHDAFSAAWYAAMRDAYLERFPDADERSKANMREQARWAAERKPVVSS